MEVVYFFPEDCRANIFSLFNRLQKTDIPEWKIHLQLIREISSLVWVFYIQIPLMNRFLGSDDDRQIDD